MANWWENDPVAAPLQTADWWKTDPVVEPPVPPIAEGEATAPFAGFNKGLDAMINLPGAAMNLGARALGYGEPFKPISVATQFNAGGGVDKALTGNEEGYEPKTLGGRVGEAIGEVAGGAVLPEAGIMAKAASMTPQALKTAAPILQKAATATGAQAAKAAALPTIGSGLGVAGAREADLGPVGEMAGGLLGGIALPNMANMAARTYGGARAGLEYANKQVERARNPEDAAYRDMADQMVKAKMDPTETYNEVAPTPSPNLAKRGLTGENMADIVSRRMEGEHPDDIGHDYGITGKTVQKYVDDFQVENPIERNLVDIAKEKLGTGGAQPITNQARADMAISNSPDAAQRLLGRQKQQPGQVADIIEQSSIGGRNLSEELERLATQGKTEERAAYAEVAKNEQPIDITDVVMRARKRALGRGGEIGSKINEALDRFFKPVAQPKRISALDDVRLKEMQERIDKAEGAERPDPARIAQLRRRFDAMRDDLEYNQNAKPDIVKPGAPIDDIRSFIDARDELSQLTQQSMKDGKSTPLTQELTQLRGELNAAARSTNKSLQAADAKYSDNRTVERMIERGGDLGKKLTPKTKQALRDFNKLTPTQQEIQRVSFEEKMASEALNVKRGNAAADQFQSDAFDHIVEAMYPKPAGKAVWQRGQNMLKRLRTAAVTTETARDLLSGSRTAPLQNDIAALMEGPKAAANLATGRFHKIMEDLANNLARKIGGKAAEERIKIATETDPAKLLMHLKRLATEAKTSAERQAYAIAIKEFAKVPRSVAAEIGTVGIQNKDRR